MRMHIKERWLIAGIVLLFASLITLGIRALQFNRSPIAKSAFSFEHDFDIPEGMIDDTLRDYERQSAVAVIAQRHDLKTQAVKGRLGNLDALQAMLSGSRCIILPAGFDSFVVARDLHQATNMLIQHGGPTEADFAALREHAKWLSEHGSDDPQPVRFKY